MHQKMPYIYENFNTKFKQNFSFPKYFRGSMLPPADASSVCTGMGMGQVASELNSVNSQAG